MSNEVDVIEKVVDYASRGLFDKMNILVQGMGDRPFMGSKLSDQERLNEYKDIRAEPYSLLHRMEAIRVEIESYLSDFSPEEREAEGVSDDVVRKASTSIVLKYVADMLKISEKLNDPVVGSAPVPPPPDPMMIGEEQWDSSTTSLPVFPDTPLPSFEPPNQMQPPPLPLPPPEPEDGLFLP